MTLISVLTQQWKCQGIFIKLLQINFIVLNILVSNYAYVIILYACTLSVGVGSVRFFLKVIAKGDTDVKQVHLYQERKTWPHYDAAAVMNAAVFQMLICRNEMHNSVPFAYCSQHRCIIAALCFCSSIREGVGCVRGGQADIVPQCSSQPVR